MSRFKKSIPGSPRESPKEIRDGPIAIGIPPAKIFPEVNERPVVGFDLPVT